MSLQPALIEYASPTLASLKCGSLFSLIPADMQLLKREAAQMSAILAPKGLSLRLIDVGGGRILCYMFRHAQLLTMLSSSREAAFLKELGYSSSLFRCSRYALRTPFHGRRFSARGRAVPRLSGRGRHRLHRKQRKKLSLLRLLEVLFKRMRRAEGVRQVSQMHQRL